MEFRKRDSKTQRSKPESQKVADVASKEGEGGEDKTDRSSPSRAKELTELNWASRASPHAAQGSSVATFNEDAPVPIDDGVNSPRVATSASSADGRPPSSDATVPTEIFVKEKGRLGDHLLDRHLITQSQLDQALAEQRESGHKLGNVLVSIGALDELVLADVLGSFFGLVSLNLRRENID